MNVRRRCSLPLAAMCAALAVSCGPTEQAQTVSFFLDVGAERLNEIEFVVSYSSGKFAATDGQCVVSSAAGPRSFAASEERLAEMDRVRMMSRKEKRAYAAVVRGLGATTSSTTVTTLAPTTTTTLAQVTTTTNLPPTTTTLGEPGTCGNGVIEVDEDEECDDGNPDSGDGCDGNCQAEFSFTAADDDVNRQLTITIQNGFGLRPGSALAFCKFQGDVAAAEIGITTVRCARSNGSTCTPTSDAIVGLSTTTTTTTTTKSTTSTTRGGDESTTSTTEEQL